MKNLHIATIVSMMTLSACANLGASHQPILDGTPDAAYAADLQACQDLARGQGQLDRDTMGSAAMGGVLGAAVASADHKATVLEGLAGGALVGLVSGAAKASDKRQSVVTECMKERGHRVVG